jgi:hypothetical protein
LVGTIHQCVFPSALALASRRGQAVSRATRTISLDVSDRSTLKAATIIWLVLHLALASSQRQSIQSFRQSSHLVSH